MTADGEGWSLADRPWIDMVDERGGRHLLSAAHALERAETMWPAAPDPLVSAAVTRFLTAIAYAAGCGPADHDSYVRQVCHGLDLGPAVAWCRAHAGELDLFDPQQPLFQDASMHRIAETDGAAMPVVYLDLTAAAGRPLLSDRRHLARNMPVAPRRAAELLLAQQMWCLPGAVSAKSAVFGERSSKGSPAAAAGKIVWSPAGTLAHILAWRLAPLNGDAGRPQWTYRVRGAPGERLAPDSPLDALTWHPRRVLLLREPEGDVANVLLAQGWRPASEGAAGPGPGCRDLAENQWGLPLLAQVLTGDGDTAPLLDAWSQAPEGTWAHAARTAAAAAGRWPDITATALATERSKKIVCRRQVTLTADQLADDRMAAAARSVVAFRRAAVPAVPPVLDDQALGLGIRLPPAFGSSLLTQESFLAAEENGRWQTLSRLAPPGAGGGFDLRTCDPAPLPPTPRPDTAVPDPLVETDMPRPAEPPPTEDEWDDDLFTTPGAGTAGPAGKEEAPAADEDHGVLLAKRLGRLNRSPTGRDAMDYLVRYAIRPDTASPAHGITRDIPDARRPAAMLMAALFALHANVSPSARRYGSTPLPRLMRAFGHNHAYGPNHPATRVVLNQITATRDLDSLRPHLTRVIRNAAEHGMTPNWPALYDDLCSWEQELVRQRWAALFYVPPPFRPDSPSAEGTAPRNSS